MFSESDFSVCFYNKNQACLYSKFYTTQMIRMKMKVYRNHEMKYLLNADAERGEASLRSKAAFHSHAQELIGRKLLI